MSDDALGKLKGEHLVVFGAGYVGLALTDAAVRAGARVTALTRNADAARRLAEAGATPVVADLQSGDWHERIPAARFAVNCVSSGGGGAAGYQASYLEGNRSVVSWLHRQPGVRAFVYTSSTSVYPQHGGTVDESSSTDDAACNARILLDAERVVSEAAQRGLVNAAIVLRLAGIYGPGRHYLLDQLREGRGPIAGRGEHRLNLVYRDDIILAIALALAGTDAGSSVFNIADDAATPKEAVVRWLAARLGLPFPGFSGEPGPHARRVDPPDRVVSNARAKRLLGWQPRFPDFRSGYNAILGA